MKERLRNNILISMQQYIDSTTLQILDTVLVHQLRNINVIEMETLPSTEMDQNEYIIKMFLARKGNKLSTKTVKYYLSSIKHLITFTDMNLIHITDMDIDDYLQQCSNKGNSATTVNNERRNIAAFFSWMRKSRLITENPCDNVELRKEIKKPIEYLEGYEIEELRDGCKDLRDRAVLEFLRSTGVRVGETVIINKIDIDMGNGDIMIYAPKTKAYRTVFLDDTAKYHVKKYLDNRNDSGIALFVSKKRPHTRLQEGSIRSILKHVAKRVDIKRSIYPHLMRKTLATTMNMHNCPQNLIQAILGHTIGSTVTNKNYAATTTDQLRQAHKQHGAA